MKAEVMADTSVALATANVQVVSSKFINRLLMVSYLRTFPTAIFPHADNSMLVSRVHIFRLCHQASISAKRSCLIIISSQSHSHL